MANGPDKWRCNDCGKIVSQPPGGDTCPKCGKYNSYFPVGRVETTGPRDIRRVGYRTFTEEE